MTHDTTRRAAASDASVSRPASARSPWPALWALVVGFFMILVDTTIVSVANPAIKSALDPATSNLDNVVWVTSAYLLAYAVPLLVTGRLGDRFGPKNLYLIGLAVFTLASLGSGLSGSLEVLIAFRAVQGLGASLMTPQTMAVITRTFPPQRRGTAMGLWGATSGVAMLVGPIAGGLLVGALGWEWVFFVNVPIGIVGFVLAWVLVPKLETHPHRFDALGVFLSASGLFLIVFGLQEGAHFDWAPWVWALIAGGVVVMGLFVWQQLRTRGEPLLPMALFRDRSFSLAGIGIATVGFMAASMTLPIMFFLQLARGLSPTDSALIMVPMAVTAGILSPLAGRALSRIDARWLVVPGMLLASGSLVAFALLMNLESPTWAYLIPSATMGVGHAGMWGPLATTATRNLPPKWAGAGSGIYNTMRTVGSVLGSAAIAALMQARLVANLPGGSGLGIGAGELPARVAAPFATAMAQATLLPAAVILIGVVAVLFLPSRPRVGDVAAGEASWPDSETRADVG